MNSPIHPDTSMQPQEIEPGLTVFACPKSGGFWIPLQPFLDWKEKHPEAAQPPPGFSAPDVPDVARERALICPESGRLLSRYQVGHGLAFHIEHSPVTGGVWLDKGEWEALKSKGLHFTMNLIFRHHPRGIVYINESLLADLQQMQKNGKVKSIEECIEWSIVNKLYG